MFSGCNINVEFKELKTKLFKFTVNFKKKSIYDFLVSYILSHRNSNISINFFQK